MEEVATITQGFKISSFCDFVEYRSLWKKLFHVKKKMVQSKIVPIDVAFLTYDPKKCSDTPVVKQDNSCVVGYEELKRHREMKRREKDTMGKLKVSDVKIQ